MSTSRDRLYELLPAVYRQRDVERGEPLRALLQVIAEQVNVVEADMAQLYENWFIETCQDWVVPYIGDLIGYQPVHEAGEPGDVTTVRGLQRNKILIPRREVANTIHYRRRKGALALLERLASDVADWPARAVEFYRLLSWTQALNHQRPSRGRTVDLRWGDALDRLGGPFDELAHTVDVRRIVSHRTIGRYNIPSIGLFVWRLQWYSVTKTPAYCLEEIGPQCYTFSVLGNDAPLYNRPQPEMEPTHIAEEVNLPAPIRRRAFEERVLVEGHEERTQASDTYYGMGKSLVIWAEDWPTEGAEQPIPRDSIIPADLSHWQYRAPRNRIVVDPALGRLAFPSSQLPKKNVRVAYHYGFSADIGGGEYTRPILQLAFLAIALFRTDHLADAAGLALKLRNPPDPLSQYLRAQSAPATQQLLDAYTGSDPLPDALLNALIDELNRVVQDQGLYDAQRFNHVNLPQEIRQLIGQNPQGQQRTHLNRLLLEAAYPEIARSDRFYRVGEQEAWQRINDALEQWKHDQPRHAVIEVADSRVYVEQLNIALGPGQSLQLRAANRTRPVIRLLDWQTDRPDSLNVLVGPTSRFTLDGFLVTGRSVRIEGIRTEDGKTQVIPTQVIIRHSTLVPGWAVHPDCEPKRPAEPSLELVNLCGRAPIEHSIIGSIQVYQDAVRADPIMVHISDSILDATSNEREALAAPGPLIAHAVLTILRSTVFGQIQTHAIDLAENTLFNGVVTVARRQHGCIRFCYVTPASRTPRRYNCQPDLVERVIAEELRRVAREASLPEPSQAEIDAARQRERERVRPQFNSTRYSKPIYCQLAHTCASEISRGAEDESEMGVFHDLYQPQRAANLRARLDEYTPAGMDAGVIYAS
jgi:hypothetical protein